jgi:hypothetical protein
VTACDACRGKPCAVCGAPVPVFERQQNPTCSPQCADIRRKAVQMKHWRKRHAADPDLPRKMHAARLAKAAADPVYAEKLRDWERTRRERHKARMKSDPEYAERFRAKVNDFYARNADRIQARRKARLDAMAPDELAAWLDRAREWCRRWRRKHYAEITAHPEKCAKYRAIQAEYRRRRALRAAAAQLARIQTRLEERRAE